MRNLLMVILVWLGSALAVQAEVRSDVKALADALGLPEIIEVMRVEGLANGEDLAEDMFPARDGAQWSRAVGKIYDAEWMDTIVLTRLDEELADTDLAPLMDYFTAETGQRIVALEVSARQAMIDETVEQASKDRLVDMRADGDPLLDLVGEYIDANDLLENNVVGAMNSNYAFYTGMQDGGAFDQALTEEQILTDVWGQEEAIRADTEEWLYAFLTTAYQPLSDDDLESYITLSRTPEGEDLNRALFAAFDTLFVEVSHALGRSAATFMAGEDI